MLTCQILQHCLSQQLRRNWTSYPKTKWKLLHGETPLQIYTTLNSCKMETWCEVVGIETNNNNSETIMFEWDLWVFSHTSDRSRSKLETAHPTHPHSSTWSN